MSTIMIYASMTGNTEEMAETITANVRAAGEELQMKEVMDAYGTDLTEHDGILLGAYTWGDGELPDEFLDFYEEMDNIDLTGKKAAVFGSCDSCYPEYGAAVDILIKKLEERGCEVVLEGLKVELSPNSDDIKLCSEFGARFVEKIRA
ncbi:flavodoxin [Paenibacillus apiarius]|uniref:flavodoxin n=1 Tax=Paenibacillus apiarius TaxID=46240 RepID=UPI003B3BA970